MNFQFQKQEKSSIALEGLVSTEGVALAQSWVL